jgi:hypothetical protein
MSPAQNCDAWISYSYFTRNFEIWRWDGIQWVWILQPNGKSFAIDTIGDSRLKWDKPFWKHSLIEWFAHPSAGLPDEIRWRTPVWIVVYCRLLGKVMVQIIIFGKNPTPRYGYNSNLKNNDCTNPLACSLISLSQICALQLIHWSINELNQLGLLCMKLYREYLRNHR